MERATVMKTFQGNLRDRDASFSSYLRPDKPISFQAHQQVTGSGRCSRILDDSTSELSIFDAHKYFNEVTTGNETTKVTITSNSRVSPVVHMEMESIPERGEVITDPINNTNTRYSSASSSIDGYANIRNYRARSFHAATPTASSEASWNSQTGLLSHPPDAIPVSVKNPPNNNDLNKKLRTTLYKPIWLLRRNCPCSGRKSVQVKENTTEPIQPKSQIMQSAAPETESDYEFKNKTITTGEIVHDHNRNQVITPSNWVVPAKSQRFHPHRVVSSVRVPLTDGFTFPVLNPHIRNGVVEDDPPRDSLEVFRPPDDVVVEPKPINPFPARAVEEDAASDASSDLFEIESFSTATHSGIYRRNSRDSFDEGSTVIGCRRSMDEESTTTAAVTEAYEPSEASIEWSVTTAEGHDDGESSVAAVAAAAERWKRRGGKGLLVSCRSEKAVSVGRPETVKWGRGEERQRGSTNVNVNGNGNGNSNSNNNNVIRVGSVNKPPLARSHRSNAPRVSLPFTT